MTEAVRVRCPGCGRENGYAAPSFPCACGNPVTPPLDPSAEARPVTYRTWSQSWVAVRCGACGREGEWPQPELGCGTCGTVVRVPVRPPGTGAAPGAGGAARPAFRPVTIRTGGDAVVTAALYLRWLGFPDVRRPDGAAAPSAAADLRAPGVVAHVDPTTAPVGLRAVECVWLNALTAAATGVCFSLAGYTEEARSRADELAVPLFVMDLTGAPQPVNDPAEDLVAQGA
ncbi:hypothetical protein [Streptomyces lavendulae]|uniref:hypothetical protein n=1 Tax=Streptomyces lavendulae TaxID=1914 RepID=UPI0036E2CE3D